MTDGETTLTARSIDVALASYLRVSALSTDSPFSRFVFSRKNFFLSSRKTFENAVVPLRRGRSWRNNATTGIRGTEGFSYGSFQFLRLCAMESQNYG